MIVYDSYDSSIQQTVILGDCTMINYDQPLWYFIVNTVKMATL